MIWLYFTHKKNSERPRSKESWARSGDGVALKVPPRFQTGPRYCYIFGCVAGVLLLGLQVHRLTPADEYILPYAADEHGVFASDPPVVVYGYIWTDGL